MRKFISLITCLLMICLISGCGAVSDDQTEITDEPSEAAMTASGNEYFAQVDQDTVMAELIFEPDDESDF